MKQKKEKEYADKRRNANYKLETKENKLSPTFETKPYEVVGRTGNEVLLRAPHEGTYRRNIKQVKSLEFNGTVSLDDTDYVTDVDDSQS